MVDSASNRALVSAPQRSFGRRLRDHRERRQITLAAMATATKIKPSLFEELERGDVSTWPCGIFRRAFVRAYGTAIGLPPETLVEEFVQLFPESDAGDNVAAPSNELRLTLAIDPWRRMIATLTRVMVALIEAGSIAATARHPRVAPPGPSPRAAGRADARGFRQRSIHTTVASRFTLARYV